jgi:SAM-dependent methyltransferase
MGTAPIQGPLWGSRVRDWAEIQEGNLQPAYLAVFDALGVGAGTRLLDVGCGAGMAAQLAAARGAQVSGLDAASASIEIARERTPAGDFRVGEMEELPFADQAFDAVTSFNAFQYAADPVSALRQAVRVSASGGHVAMVVWGEPQDCEHAATLAALGPLMPPPPPGAGGPFALSAPGKVEALMEQAGLVPTASGYVECPFDYPDAETAWRGISSAGPYVVAMRHSGDEAVKSATLASLAPFATSSGGYRQQNKFRYVVAAASAARTDQSGQAGNTAATAPAAQPTAVKRRWWPWGR